MISAIVVWQFLLERAQVAIPAAPVNTAPVITANNKTPVRPKSLIPLYQPVPRGNVKPPLPTAEQQAIPPDIEKKLARLVAAAPRTALPAGPNAYAQRQFQADVRAWYTKTYVEGYRKSQTRDPRWDDAAIAFIEAAIDAIVEHDLRDRTLRDKLEVLQPLVQEGRAVLDLGCADPLVLSLLAEVLANVGNHKESIELLRRAMPEFANAGYSLEAGYYATMLNARIPDDLERMFQRKYDAADMMVHVLKHRQYDRIERRILFQQFATVANIRQQPSQVAAALREETGTDPWLAKMILGHYHAGIANDLNIYRHLANDFRLQWESPEATRILSAHHRAAVSLFLSAWDSQPELPEAATELLNLASRLQHGLNEPARFWFDQAVAAQFDHLPAYQLYLSYFRNRWGSEARYEEMLEFGRECLATKRFDTDVPDQFRIVAIPALMAAKHQRSLASYPTLFDEFSTWYEGYRQQPLTREEDLYSKTLMLGIAWLFDRKEYVQTMLTSLGNELDSNALSALKIKLADLRLTAPTQATQKTQTTEPSEPTRPAPVAGHRGAIKALTFIDHDKSVLSSGSDGTIRLWSAEKGEQAKLLPGDDAAAKLCAFSPDGTLVAIVGEKPQVVVWKTANGELVRRLEIPSTVQSLALNANGILAIASQGDSDEGGEISLWRLADGARIAVLTGHSEPIHDLAFSPTTNLLVSVAGRAAAPKGEHPVVEMSPYNMPPAELVVWDLNSDQAMFRLTPFGTVIHRIEFSRDGKLLAIAGQDWGVEKDGFLTRTDLVRMLRTDDWQTVGKFSSHHDLITGLAFLRHDKIVASGSADGSIHLWDVSISEELAILTGHKTPIQIVTAAADSLKLASADDEGNIKFWDFETSGVRSMAKSPLLEHEFSRLVGIETVRSGRYLLSCDQWNGVTLWEPASGYTSGMTFRAPSLPFTYSCDISPDGTKLVTAGGLYDRLSQAKGPDRGVIILWDIASGKIKARFEGNYGNVYCVRFAPDGKCLASGGNDGKVIIWNLSTGKPWAWGTLKEHLGEITALRFSPDGKMLASGSSFGQLLGKRQNGNFRIWDLPNDPQAVTPTLASRLNRDSYDRGVQQLAFSPQGDRLLASSDEVVDLWETADFEKKLSVPGRVLAFSPDGSHFAAGGANPVSGCVVWNTTTGQEVRRFDAHASARLWAVTFSPDGHQIFASVIGKVFGWDIESGAELTELDRSEQ